MNITMRCTLLLLAALSLALTACKDPTPKKAEVEAVQPKQDEQPKQADATAKTPEEPLPAAPAPSEPSETPPAAKAYDRLDRASFNRMAVRLDAPVFWKADANNDGVVRPDELVELLYYPSERKKAWIAEGAFTSDFDALYEAMLASRDKAIPDGLEASEAERRRLVIEDLDQGKSTLVFNDLRSLTPEEKSFVRLMLEAGALIDELYATQNGIVPLRAQLAADDLASHSLFRRNWGPRCKGPSTETNPACHALASKDKPIVDVYAATLQGEAGFCQKLEAAENTKALLDPFVVVRVVDENLLAVPYTTEYAALMTAVADKLRAAAALLPETEAALRAYLEAAAAGFGSNDWQPADEAWAAMNARNSKWYVRVGPDEVYWEPCSQKAGFHLTFALINPDSLTWEEKLLPHQQGLEDALASLIGPAYEARTVTFHLPDFIDIVSNSGDDRNPFGATIGQSLPNWGPVANEGRGRTVVMSNLYTDSDSLDVRLQQARSLFDTNAMKFFEGKGKPNLLSTILHEATHNFGPSHEFKVDGKTDGELFGGALSTVLEELKAQTGTLFYIQVLLEKGVLTPEEAAETYADCFLWAMGHISRGMYTADKLPRPYSQLAAIQLGYFMEHGAIEFAADTAAPNGSDKGVFVMHFERFPELSEKLMKEVGVIKATGDRAAAQAMLDKYVDAQVIPAAVITERMLRFPKASMVYALQLD